MYNTGLVTILYPSHTGGIQLKRNVLFNTKDQTKTKSKLKLSINWYMQLPINLHFIF